MKNNLILIPIITENGIPDLEEKCWKGQSCSYGLEISIRHLVNKDSFG